MCRGVCVPKCLRICVGMLRQKQAGERRIVLSTRPISRAGAYSEAVTPAPLTEQLIGSLFHLFLFLFFSLFHFNSSIEYSFWPVVTT